MSSPRLPNYLRTHRKRAGLTQAEVAYLLGCRSGAKVSRYERFARTPSIQTLFATEVIFGAPVRELFAGGYGEAERRTLRRVHALLKHLEGQRRTDRLTARKLEALRAIQAHYPLSESRHEGKRGGRGPGGGR